MLHTREERPVLMNFLKRSVKTNWTCLTSELMISFCAISPTFIQLNFFRRTTRALLHEASDGIVLKNKGYLSFFVKVGDVDPYDTCVQRRQQNSEKNIYILKWIVYKTQIRTNTPKAFTETHNWKYEGLPGGLLVPLFPSKIALCSHVPTLSQNVFVL